MEHGHRKGDKMLTWQVIEEIDVYSYHLHMNPRYHDAVQAVKEENARRRSVDGDLLGHVRAHAAVIKAGDKVASKLSKLRLSQDDPVAGRRRVSGIGSAIRSVFSKKISKRVSINSGKDGNERRGESTGPP